MSLIEKMIEQRRKMESVTMNILRSFLVLAKNYPKFYKYLSTLPPLSYCYANFHDWIPSFIEYFY